MLFISRNERNELAWQLIRDGRKTVTRRYREEEPGKIRAVQPGRGKKAIDYIKIISCIPHKDWIKDKSNYDLEKEAYKEGFYGWEGLLEWFKNQHADINDTNRIEFELITQCRTH